MNFKVIPSIRRSNGWPYEKSCAPDFIKVDIGMYSSTSGDDRGFALYFQHNRTWINSLGAEWRNEIQLGTNQILASSFYQPLDIAQRFFVEPEVFFNQDWENVFYEGNDIRDSVRVHFTCFGSSSLDVEAYAYVSARDKAEFQEIQETLLLRIMECIDSTGGQLSTPVHYPDRGLDYQ